MRHIMQILTISVLSFVALSSSQQLIGQTTPAPWTTNGNNINNTNSGNVGIGTSNPGRPLEVLAPNGDALRLYRNANFPGWGANMTFAFNNSNNARVDYAGLHGVIQSNTAGAEIGNLVFSTLSAGSLTERMRIGGSGNVGIGSNNPDKLFVVQGAIPAPIGALSVFRTTGTFNGFGVLLDAAGSGNNNLGFSVQGQPKGTFAWDVAREFLGFTNFISAQQDFSLRLNKDGSLTYHDGNIWQGPEKFRLTKDGDVTLTGKLSAVGGLCINGDCKTAWSQVGGGTGSAANVAAGQFGQNTGGGNYTFPGNVTAVGTISAGTIKATYQDVAEWVPSAQKLSAGTVVVLDISKSNQVLASTQSYDTRIAGVISAQPGITLGEQADNKVLVATTGRVRVKVDATKAPIQIGDLLVTSDIPGTAMKSVPVDFAGRKIHLPGTIVGKALEPLEKGTGEILVLLSIQ